MLGRWTSNTDTLQYKLSKWDVDIYIYLYDYFLLVTYCLVITDRKTNK